MSSSKICVVCVSERRDVVNMFSLYYGSIPASTFIMDILKIKVASDTGIRVVMCNRCNSSLNNFYKFYKMVRDAQHKYNEMKLQLQDGRSNEICFVNVKPEPEVSTEYMEVESMKQEYLEDVVVEDTNEFTEQVDIKPYPLDTTLISESKPDSKVTNVGAENSKNCHEMSGEIIKEAPTLEADFIPRSERATTAVFEKYKVEDIYSNRKWKISEEEKDEIFQLYIDMKCNKCDAHFSNYSLLDQHCTTIHDESALVTCDDFTLPSYQHMERHILYKHILNRRTPRVRIKVPCIRDQQNQRDQPVPQFADLNSEAPVLNATNINDVGFVIAEDGALESVVEYKTTCQNPSVTDAGIPNDSSTIHHLINENNTLKAEITNLWNENESLRNHQDEIDQKYSIIQMKLDKIIETIAHPRTERNYELTPDATPNEGTNVLGDITFPIATMSDLETLENRLHNNPEAENYMIDRFSKICGTSGTMKVAKIGHIFPENLNASKRMHTFDPDPLADENRLPQH